MNRSRLASAVLMTILLLALTCTIASAATVYVKWNATGPQNGTSWTTAYRTVQAGLNAAVSGSEVWVARGTYTQCITLKAGVALYGGFVGTETTLGQRDYVANVTIIDGNQAGSVVTSPAGATSTTRIDGLTIRNGSAGSAGGGVSCPNSSPTIANNIITNNRAYVSSSDSAYGGGVYCSNSSPIITNNTISYNTVTGSSSYAAYGGGIGYTGGSPTITGNTIIGNKSMYGGAISCMGAGTGVITNNVIAVNESTAGGAIYCYNTSPTIANNTMVGNKPDAVYCFYNASAAITNNTIVGSISSGVYCSQSSPVVSNNILANNGTGVSKVSGSPTLRNNCVYGNSTNYSGIAPGTGDISADPMLADTTFGDLHIQPGSPCIDAGYDTAVQAGWTDIDVQARIQGAHADIGSDETDGTTWTAGPRIVVRVSPSGNDANNGSTWALAKKTIQAAIDTASASHGEVWVSAGTYQACITVRAYAFLYGGFAGTETAKSQRDWKANRTILDGGGVNTTVIFSDGGNCQICGIDGFIIKNGRMPVGGGGGGIRCTGSSPLIANNFITSNLAPDSAYGGGGIYCASGYSGVTGGVAVITNNTIVGNCAYIGGGITCSYSAPKITNNVIASNTAEYSAGGGIYCTSSSPTITNNVITANIAVVGGGIACANSTSGLIANNIMRWNSASTATSGAGINCALSSPTIVNNTIVSNNSFSSLDGAGVTSDSSTPVMANNIIAYNGLGIYRTGSGGPALNNNCVYGNTINYSGLSAGAGDITLDPQLADRANGNLHIQPGSPCANTGLDSAVLAGWTDMDGQARIQGSHVDMGADESDGTAWAPGPYVIVRVSPSGNDANDGSTWELAMQTVQAGIEAAASLGGEVWVAAGTYKENLSLHPHAYLYGGFAGTETARTERDWNVHKTILDGNASGVVVNISGGRQVSGIDGFAIRNGSLGVGSLGDGPDGGIVCTAASPVIANNRITGNFATSAGGVYCNYSSPVIANSTISEHPGGGVYCSNSSPTITNSTIVGNGSMSLLEGCGVYAQNSSLVIRNCIIAFNSTGIYKTGTGTPVLSNNCVYGNVGYNYSGLSAGAGDVSADPQLVDITHGDLHIQSGSPCVNAGLDSAVQSGWRDADAQARIQGSHVDIGSDESDGTTWTAGPRVIVRVSPSGSDANDGSSWALAKKTVQAAIYTACESGGEVWVKAGTYNERVILPVYVHLFGGFAGTETARAQRNWTANRAILDAVGAGGPVVTIGANGCNQSITVDGLTLRNGIGAMWATGRCGGGVFCLRSSPMIANNTITGNAQCDYGGGIYFQSSSPIIRNNTVSSNSAVRGGGIYCNGTPLVTGNTISGNTAGAGGGIFTGFNPIITNNIITGNNAYDNSYGGGGIYCYYNSPVVTNNTIAGNTAMNGGAMYFMFDSRTSSTLSNNTIAFNNSGLYRYNSSGTLTLRNNCVYSNGTNYYGLTAGTGDISVDPLLVNRTGGDYHLTASSPCKNVGWNSAPGIPTTDMDGQGRIFGTAVDIGADEYWTTSASLFDAKSLADGVQTSISGLAVSAAFDGYLYIESDTRAHGIRVDKSNHGISAADKVIVSGTLATNDDGERYINAQAVTPNGAGTIESFFLTNKVVGGAGWFHNATTGAGQKGLKEYKAPLGSAGWETTLADMSGLNNIGLLVSTVGRVTYADAGFFYLDDGSALNDGSSHVGLKVLGTVPAPVPMPEDWNPVGHYVKVTGASSCYKRTEDLFRLIRATEVTLIQ